MANFNEDEAKKYLSGRGINTARFSKGENNFLDFYMRMCMREPYSKDKPDGYANLGTAENYLCEQTLIDKLNTSDMNTWTKPMLHYFEYEGDINIRSSIAAFFQRYFKPYCKLNPDHFALVNGTCSVLDGIVHSVAEPGDVFLSPAPYYTRIHNDFCERSQISTYNVNYETTSNYEFNLTVENFQKSYDSATSEGKRVRGLIILSPSNPLGISFSKEQILPVLEWAKTKDLYIIIDEIYGLSYFAEGSEFESTFSYEVPDPMKTFRTWGMSKDFGMPGIRSSIVHSVNEQVLAAFTTICVFNCVPPVIAHITTSIMNDHEWLENVYFPENISKLRQGYQEVTQRFDGLGIKYLKANAGFFVFADFSKYCAKIGGERELFDRFMEARIYCVPGKQLFCPLDGWFRIIFCIDKETLKIGLDRIENVVRSIKL